MSTVKIEITVDASNVSALNTFLNELAGQPKTANEIKVNGAEEVKDPKATLPSGKPRPSRAKAKPEPVEEEIEEELEAEENDDLEAEEAEDDITIDDIRAKQAEKIGKHKLALIEKYKEFDAKGVSSLDPKHYREMYDFMANLK